jgi:hypothetical protein
MWLLAVIQIMNTEQHLWKGAKEQILILLHPTAVLALVVATAVAVAAEVEAVQVAVPVNLRL